MSQSDKPSVDGLYGFNRAELADIAEGLEQGYPRSYNVGDECPEVESTTAYAARFIRAALGGAPVAPETCGGPAVCAAICSEHTACALAAAPHPLVAPLLVLPESK